MVLVGEENKSFQVVKDALKEKYDPGNISF